MKPIDKTFIDKPIATITLKNVLHIFLIAFLPLVACAQQDTLISLPQYPVGMTVEQFNLKLKTTTKPLLVNFTADWCVVCKRQKPILDQVMAEVKDQVELLVIDMESNPLIASYFEVDGLPVMILYKDGSMIWNRVGYQDKAQILDQVSSFMDNRNYRKGH